MNKKVVVFSTYYLSPCPSKEDKIVFNRKSVTQKHFSEIKICDFFWNNIKNRKSLIDKIRNEYLCKEGKDELFSAKEVLENQRQADLNSFLKSKKEEINTLIKNAGAEIEIKNNETDWIYNLYFIKDTIKEEEKELYNELLTKYDSLNSDTELELMKDKDGIWIAEHLNPKGAQDGFEIYLPSGLSTSADGYQSEPWLYNRLSYYQLNCSKENCDVDIFAVWPISTRSPIDLNNKSGNEWIGALSNQFLSIEKELGNNVDCLYLVLHAKDVMPQKGQEDVLFEDKYNGKDRVVILFEHAEDIGNILCDKNKKDIDILKFVETKYKKVNNSYTEIERIIQNNNLKVEQDEETMAKIRKLNSEIKELLQE